MNITHIDQITETLGLNNAQVQAVAALLEEGATVPFIARYRKEATGSLDEVVITFIRDHLAQLAQIDLRKAAILKSLEQHGHLTEELKGRVLGASTLAALEDIYLPYRPKRRTRGAVAREKGLEPLALMLFDQQGTDPLQAAVTFLDPEKGVNTVEEALAGARDIIAEMVNEDSRARAQLRELFLRRGMFRSKVIPEKETPGAKYKDYFDWEEPAARAPSHRILAMRRGEREEILDLTVAPAAPEALEALERLFVRGATADAGQVRQAVHDCYTRLLSRSMETELRVALKEKADAEAIRVFAENLRQLLLTPPLGAKRVMGLDPGFAPAASWSASTGRARSCINDTIYPHLSERQAREAADTVQDAMSSASASRPSPWATAPRAAKPRPSSSRRGLPASSGCSWSTKVAPPSIRPPKPPARNFPSWTLPCAVPSPLVDA